MAQAAPPVNRSSTPHALRADAPGASSSDLHPPMGRLDLAPPGLAATLVGQPAAVAFTVVPRRITATDSSLPTLGAGSADRVMSRPEQLARNFKREGLPLAKLFQTENALLHVGFSPKGKPGLWFVERLH